MHRDLKPQNILFLGKVPKICDFGLAKKLGGSSSNHHLSAPPASKKHTAEIGSLMFVSPEQRNGPNYDVKVRFKMSFSNIWSETSR